MNWIHAFELLCYAITAVLLADICHRKSLEEFWLFLSAAVAGFALELLAVWATDIYHYSRAFFIRVGFEPYQFPFFGGLMWGGLTVVALRTARHLQLSLFLTAISGGWLIVTMDLFLDVAAIRLDGGFWVWDGRIISSDISHHLFMSVIWVNFLGYLYETPAILTISLRTAEKRKTLSVIKQFLYSIGIGAAGVVFVGAASGLSLFLNRFTDEWFACIAFVLLWTFLLAVILRAAFSGGLHLQCPSQWDLPVLIYWSALYGFCITALFHLGFAVRRPLYLIACLLLGMFTLILSITEKKER